MNNSIWRLLTAQPTALQLCEWEAAVPAEAQGKNPYRAEEVELTLTARHESGSAFTVPGFCYEPYCVTDEAVLPLENVAPTFRFRVAFPCDGTWHIEMTVAVDGTVCNTSYDTVTVASATAFSPLLQVEPAARQTFCTADGAPVLLSGVNMETARADVAGLNEITAMMKAQSPYGANYIYVRNGAPFASLHASAHTRRQDVSALWDALFEAAETTGTYLHMSLFGRDEVWNGFNEGVWHEIQPDAISFHGNAQTKAAVKDYLRYVVARWGYSHRLLAWDLSENLDWNTTLQTGERASVVAAWAREMVNHLRTLDPVHMVSTGILFPCTIPALYEPFDFLSLRQCCYHGVGQLAEMQKFVYRTCGIPALMMDTGLTGATAKVAKGSLREDLASYHLQNWTGVMAWGAGTAMSRDCKEVAQFEAYRELPVLLNFAREIPWTDQSREMLGVSNTRPSHGRMGVHGYRGKTYAYLWIFDLRYVPVTPSHAIPFEDESVTFAMPAGSYRVRCVDTRTGETVREESLACNGTLQVTLPRWEKDIAVAVTAE